MSWLATAGLIFGKTLAKSLIKYWLNDGFLNDFLEEGVDKGTDQISTWMRKSSIETTIERVVQNLIPVFNSEGSSLDEASKNNVVLSLVNAFEDIDGAILIKLNLDSEALKQYVLTTYPNQTRDFSLTEASFYNRMLDEICKAVVKIAPTMDAFDYTWTSEFLKDQDKLISLVDKIMKSPDDADFRFDNKYRQVVSNELDKVDFLGVGKIDDITHRQSLSVSYVTLLVSTRTDSTEEYSNKRSAKFLKRKSKYFSNPEGVSRNVDQILSNGSRFIIRGEAGAGKTTLMHWLAVRSAQKNFPDALTSWNELVPFVIRLRDYSKSDEAFPKPEEFPVEVAEMVVGDMPKGWVHRQLDAQRSLILIDGIDELPFDKRNKMLERLSQLVSLYPFNHYIITSRPAALKSQNWKEWERWAEDEEFVELSFQPMDIQRIELFISQWHKALYLARIEKEADSISLAGGLKRIINRRSDLMKLAENPLLCAMLCALHHDRRDSLPSDRRQLYKECIEILVERRDIKRDITLGIPLNIEAKIKLLRYLAYWMMDNQYARIDIKICDEKLDQKAKSLSKAKGIKGKDIRIFFVERSNLLREPAVGQIEFVHRSFQEYLAAQHAVLDERNFGALIKNAQDDQWRDLIILAIGEVPNRKDRDYILIQLVKLADTLKNPQVKNKVRLMAAIGLEQSIEAPTSKVEKLIMNAVNDVIPPKSAEEIDLLSMSGNRVIPLLRYNDSYTEEELAHCVKTLAQIGTPDVLNSLEEYNQSKSAIVVNEICNAWDAFDKQQYVKQILSKQKKFIRNTPISSLQGFDGLKLLEDLRIWIDQKNIDLNPLIVCKKLASLSIFSEEIVDLRPLCKMENLKELNIGLWTIPKAICGASDNLADISCLLEIQSLERLSIFAKKVDSLVFLREMPNLQSLKVVTSVDNLDCIEDLSNLNELCIGVLPIPDLGDTNWVSFGIQLPLQKLPSLANAPNLKSLSLGFLKIDDIGQLKHLKDLSRLTLISLNIPNIDVLSDLENLEELHLFSLPIDNLSALAHMKKLRKLYISATRIKDLSPISNLENLEVLGITSCPVHNLEPIKSLKKLMKLEIKKVPAEPVELPHKIRELSIELVDNNIFFDIYNYINTHPSLSAAEIEDTIAEFKDIEFQLTKKENIDVPSIVRHFHNLYRMAPDIKDKSLKLLENPTLEFSKVIHEVTKKLEDKINT